MTRKRLAAAMLAATLVTAGTSLIAAPAFANDDICAGTGTAHFATGFGYSANFVHILHPHTSSFTFSPTVWVCMFNLSFTATGVVTGYCEFMSGSGMTNDGHTFSFNSVGTSMAFTGAFTGTATIQTDPSGSGSCTTETATRFLITGAFAKNHLPITAAPPLCTQTGTVC